MPSQSAPTLRSRYVEQAASDLRENRRLQRELTEKVEMLKQEETLLVDILTLAERFEAPQDPPSVPAQAQDEPEAAAIAPDSPAASAAKEETSRPRAQVTDEGAGTGKRTSKAAAKARSRQPLLGDIFMDLLREHGEPRLAKELRDELLRLYPDRTPTPQVVRNTLEALVAKSRIQRHRQDRSVMYSVAKPAA